MEIYLVGGAVRDALLHLPIKDRDWVVVGGTEKLLLEKNFQQVGKDFPVFLHPETHEEYALARKERKSGKGYTGFSVDFCDNVTLEEDLIRRDLTMNAIAQDQNGNYIDPFKGKKDIESRLIRHVSKSFTEDPLRVLRTARFAASLMHLGFKIAKETMNLMCVIVNNRELSYLTPNRIWNETEKAFRTLNPHVYFQVLYACKALCFLFPEIYCLYEKRIILNVNIFKRLHDNLIFFDLAKISLLNQEIDVRFAYLCQFLSYNFIFFKSSKQFYDEESARIVRNLCQRLQIPFYIRDLAVLNTGFCSFLNTIHYQSSKNIIKFFFKIDAWRKPERIKKLAFLSNCHALKHNYSKVFYFEFGCFLKKSFSVIQDISIELILKQGFKGHEIKKELIRLRINKLELWRIKNIKKSFF